MSEKLDKNEISRLKNEFMEVNEATLQQNYKNFRQYCTSSGRASKQTREIGMAYVQALSEKRQQREQLLNQRR